MILAQRWDMPPCRADSCRLESPYQIEPFDPSFLDSRPVLSIASTDGGGRDPRGRVVVGQSEEVRQGGGRACGGTAAERGATGTACTMSWKVAREPLHRRWLNQLQVLQPTPVRVVAAKYGSRASSASPFPRSASPSATQRLMRPRTSATGPSLVCRAKRSMSSVQLSRVHAHAKSCHSPTQRDAAQNPSMGSWPARVDTSACSGCSLTRTWHAGGSAALIHDCAIVSAGEAVDDLVGLWSDGPARPPGPRRPSESRDPHPLSASGQQPAMSGAGHRSCGPQRLRRSPAAAPAALVCLLLAWQTCAQVLTAQQTALLLLKVLS